MGKMPTDSLGKSSELKLQCFCLIDAYSMPKDICSAVRTHSISGLKSRVLKLTFLALKMIVKSGLEFILKSSTLYVSLGML